MNEDSGLLLPNLVPVENRIILPPDVEEERKRQLAALDEMEAEYDAEHGDDDDEQPELRERARFGVCKACGHRKLVFVPAMLCERDLRKAAEDAGLEFPEAAPRRLMNRAERRAVVKRAKKVRAGGR